MDRILSIDQIVSERIIPLSRTSLYRLAENGEIPLFKRKGRWMGVESDLRKWVREGQRGGSNGSRKRGYRAQETVNQMIRENEAD